MHNFYCIEYLDRPWLREVFDDIKLSIDELCPNVEHIGMTFDKNEDKNDLLAKVKASEIVDSIPGGSIVFLMHPYFYREHLERALLQALREKDCITVLWVSDVVSMLWGLDCVSIKLELEMLALADVLIVPSEDLRWHLCEYGIKFDNSKFFYHQIYDYRIQHPEGLPAPERGKDVVFSGNINARFNDGNLSFVDFPLSVYSLSFDNSLFESPLIHYRGYIANIHEFFVDIVKHCSFGLVSANDVFSHTYYRYCVPYKLTTYISAGLPVVINSLYWYANDIVKKYNIGIAVDKLSDISDAIYSVSEEDYRVMHENAVKLSKKLRDGYFTKTVIGKVLAYIGKI